MQFYTQNFRKKMFQNGSEIVLSAGLFVCAVGLYMDDGGGEIESCFICIIL